MDKGIALPDMNTARFSVREFLRGVAAGKKVHDRITSAIAQSPLTLCIYKVSLRDTLPHSAV